MGGALVRYDAARWPRRASPGYATMTQEQLLSHGENRGSSPLGSANKINNLCDLAKPLIGTYGKNTAYK